MEKNIKALHNQIANKFYKDIIDVLNSAECKHYFYNLMTRAIKEEVYDKYKPLTYKRRMEDRGLIDESNYTYRVSVGKNGIIIFMKNITEGVGRAFMIDEGIVTGKDPVTGDNFYEYGALSNQITPRDFYGYMKVLVKKDNELTSIIQRHMSAKGWGIK